MPPAIISAQCGGVLAAMQQAQFQKASALQLAQYQNQLQQGQTTSPQNQYGSLLAQQQMNASPKSNAWYHRQRAEEYADDGEKLIDRMAFWAVMPVIGDRIADRLADKLEHVAERLETELERA